MALPYKTSLSELSDHEWNIISSRWSRGIDWTVHKIGKRWEIGGRLGKGFPHFNTKKEAFRVASDLVCAETHYRSAIRNGLPTYN